MIGGVCGLGWSLNGLGVNQTVSLLLFFFFEKQTVVLLRVRVVGD